MSRYFWPIFTPLPLSHFVTHPGTPTKVRHTSRTPPIFSRPSTKIPDKSPLYKFYFNCSRRFLSGGFVRVGFCPIPLLSQYICYNRKLNIILNSCFICIIKICISVTSHALDPLPSVTNCHTFSDPLPLERDVLYERPLVPSSHGRRLRGDWGTVPPKQFEVGDGPCIRPPNIWRSSVMK